MGMNNNSIDFVTADHHFSHYRIPIFCGRTPWLYPNPDFNPDKPEDTKFNCKWAVNLKAHDEALRDNWNAIVPKKSTVAIVGDFAFHNHAQHLQGLNGSKIMILGTHDKMSQDVLRLFKEVHEMGCVKNINKQLVTICHYAMRSWHGSFHGSWQLYGHSHGRMPEFDNMFSFDIGVDIWGYQPVPWEVVVKKMDIIKSKIQELKLRVVDGERKAFGEYDKDPDQRVIDTRKKNKAIMQAMGIPINETMWPNT
jgi:calcineurin-like phosphoesterase family protein